MKLFNSIFDAFFYLGVLLLGFQLVLWLLSVLLPARAFEWLMAKFEMVLNIRRVWFMQVLLSIVLLKALGQNRYSYYRSLRWTCFFIFILLIAHSISNERKGWAMSFGLLLVVYNPIFPIHLDRETWSIINIITIAVALGSILVLKENKFEDFGDKKQLASKKGAA